MLFNGTSSRAETTGLGGVTSGDTARTFAATVNRTSSSGFRCVLSLLSAANATQLDMSFNGTTMIMEATGGGLSNGPTVGTGHMYLGLDKAAGSATPRFHKQVYGTDAAVAHSNGSAAVGSPTGSAKIGLGTFDNNSDWWAGDIFAVAIWDRQLADWEHEWLACDLSAYLLLNPDWLVFGDWGGALPANIPDFSGNGAPLTTLTNMAVSTASMPVGYGAPPLGTFQPAAGGATDLTLTPGAANVDWVGSTPGVKADISRSPGTPDVAWSGSTPALKVDISRSPAAPNVDWTGSTPAVKADIARQPGAAEVAWSGSTPSVILEGEVTLSPGSAEVVWTGSPASVVVVPDVVEVPEDAGGGAIEGFEDFSTEERVRNLRLTPGVAVVAWTGSRPTLRIADGPGPLRVRLPRRRQAASEAPEPRDLTLSPGAAVVAYSGSPAVVRAASYPTVERVEALERRLAELEERREEEALVFAALSRR